MKRFILPLLFVAQFLTIESMSQSSSSIKTYGSCNPVVAGGSVNQITIRCTGVSTAKADKMIELMNRILEQHLDLDQVSSKLDQLNTEMRSLNEALNPLSGAPQAAKDFLNETQNLWIECSGFVTTWTQKETELTVRHSDLTNNNLRDMPSMLSNRPATNATDKQKLAEFSKSLSPRLAALIARYRKAMPQETLFPNYESINSLRDLYDFNDDMSSMDMKYVVLQKSAGRSPDPSLTLEYTHVSDECFMFWREWAKASSASNYSDMQSNWNSMNANRVNMANDLAHQKEELAHQKSLLYSETLGPRLLVWKNKIMPKLPDVSSDLNYSSVKTSAQLNSVCSEVFNLGMAYRGKILSELHAK
jgi:hypothetical protein